MRRSAFAIQITEEGKGILSEWLRRGKTERRLGERAKIVLLAHEGKTNQEIAVELDTRTARSKWCRRFGKDGLASLSDAVRPGKPAHYDKATERRVLCLLDQRPPKGYSQWNGNRLAEVLGDVSKAQIWRILCRHDICLQRKRSWCAGVLAAAVQRRNIRTSQARSRSLRGASSMASSKNTCVAKRIAARLRVNA